MGPRRLLRGTPCSEQRSSGSMCCSSVGASRLMRCSLRFSTAHGWNGIRPLGGSTMILFRSPMLLAARCCISPLASEWSARARKHSSARLSATRTARSATGFTNGHSALSEGLRPTAPSAAQHLPPLPFRPHEMGNFHRPGHGLQRQHAAPGRAGAVLRGVRDAR